MNKTTNLTVNITHVQGLSDIEWVDWIVDQGYTVQCLPVEVLWKGNGLGFRAPIAEIYHALYWLLSGNYSVLTKEVAGQLYTLLGDANGTSLFGFVEAARQHRQTFLPEAMQQEVRNLKVNLEKLLK